ncbi:UNVERIFIED_CONTAM: ToMV susceptible protein tm-2 [Sesamum calycinum]|uniref:ToMV susceptible protein tm-2 n=1 Tax=Sesamum calycinum TaxID=2727403 RepID=A0AAW2RNW6_9LAMI
MRTLQSYLKDADYKRSTRHEAANLIIDIRDLAHDVEDILDTYLPEMNPLLVLEKCGVTADANAGVVIDADLQDRRKLFLRAPHELKIVGREGILRTLEEEILSEESRRIIKSIVGAAGVGKTTVGKRVYERTKNRFEVSAIVYVSQEPNLGELLLDIANQVGLSKDKVEEDLVVKDLFFDSILQPSEEPLPLVLREIGERISERCDGLPLAIVDLPTELKPLFLYFGMFPEDSEIFVNSLINIWVSEKLIKADGSRKPQSIAEASIDKLISRNLIQVSRRRSDGRARSLCIHDRLHNLCIQLAEDNNFFCTLNKLKAIATASIVRRVTCTSNEHVDQDYSVPKKILIIDIGRGQENNLPSEIANLSGLTHLTLKHSSKYRPISDNIGRYVSFDTAGLAVNPKYPKGVAVVLPNLETLDFHEVDGYYITPYSFNESNLRMLRTREVCRQPLKFLSDATPSLQKLEDIKLGRYFEDEMGGSISRLNLSPYQYLVRLHLEWFPLGCQINFPPNLVQVVLKRADDKICVLVESLKTLSKLEIIKIKDSYGGNNLDFSGEHSFRQLQVLVLRDVHFDKLIVDEKGMPKLYKMIYRAPPSICSQIIPERLEKIMVVHGR